MTTDYLPDLPSLLVLCAQAAREAEQQHEALRADADAEELLAVEEAAKARFGTEAAATFGRWQPTDNPPPETLQMFARLTDTVYLRYTSELDGALPDFDLVVNCDHCLTSRETRVHDLVGLAAALTGAGVQE